MLGIKSFFVLALLFLGSAQAYALPVHKAHVEVELMPEVRSIQLGKSFWVILRLKMDEGWHTYWRNPGDSGLATSVNWNFPGGFKAGPLLWPYPEKFKMNSLTSYGYEGEVYLLTEVQTPKKLELGTIQKFRGKVNWVACKDICVWGNAELDFELPVEEEAKPSFDELEGIFQEARLRLPVQPEGWDTGAMLKRNKMILQVRPPSRFQQKIEEALFFSQDLGVVNYGGKQSLKQRKDSSYEIHVPLSKKASKKPKRIAGVLVLRSKGAETLAFQVQKSF